ncbi:hypothetical protein DNTS_033991, partial [Danionella cerebrum]
TLMKRRSNQQMKGAFPFRHTQSWSQKISLWKRREDKHPNTSHRLDFFLIQVHFTRTPLLLRNDRNVDARVDHLIHQRPPHSTRTSSRKISGENKSTHPSNAKLCTELDMGGVWLLFSHKCKTL